MLAKLSKTRKSGAVEQLEGGSAEQVESVGGMQREGSRELGCRTSHRAVLFAIGTE